MAIDRDSREIVGLYIGDRDRAGVRDCGTHCRRFIVNVLSAIRIFGPLMKRFSPRKGIGVLGKKAVKPIISNGLIVQ